MRELLADARKDDERKAKANGRGKREEHALKERRPLLAVNFRSAQDRAVRRDERQKDAQRRVQGRQKTFHRDVNELHKRRDDKDERERVNLRFSLES